MSCCTFGMGDGAPIRIPTPDLEGLVMWTGGDGSIITSADDTDGDPRCVGWTNLVYPLNGHLFAVLFGLGDGPYTGLDTLDGHPGLTWRFDVDHTENLNIDAVGGGGVPQSMLNRNGVIMNGIGLTTAATLFAVIIPRFSSNVFGQTGGTVAVWAGSPYFSGLFDLRDNPDPNAFYVISTTFDWEANLGSSQVAQGPDTAGGAGGIYNGVPLVVQWSRSASNGKTFRINGVAQATTPVTMDTTPAFGTGWLLGNRSPGDQSARFKGAMFEILALDYDIETNPTALTQLYTYLADRYPSIAITIP